MNIRTSFFVAALLLTACGGGSGSAPTALAPPNATGAAAIQPISSFGAISAFGSVVVNGVRFDISSATLSKNGAPATQAELAVGQMALVHGSADSNGGNGHADRVDVEAAVLGNVASIDTANNKLVVLGQTIVVSANTSFSASISSGGLSGLAAGDYIEVSGNTAATGDLNATRIEKETGTAFQVLGTIAALDSTGHTFKINALTVNYGSATLDAFATGHPANGDVVIIRGTTFTAATTTLTATRVLPSTVDPRSIAGHDAIEQEGLITRFASATDFDVAGKKVTTNSSTIFHDGSAADLAMNAKVEVRGTLDATGTLIAAVITIQHTGVIELSAAASAVNTTTSTVTVLGVNVTLNAMTRLEDKSSARLQLFSINDIHTGDSLLIRGYESPAGSGNIIATRVERIPAQLNVVYVRGPFTATTAPQFKILSVVVDTTGATFFLGEHSTMPSAIFFSSAPGKIVLVRGTLNGTIVAATQIAIAAREDD